ncbi:hypothetical protein AVA65_08185 [Salmonella enterica subsp. enterica serovar Minnesota]|nr:hypothetical protein [Salmonella enterica subsp. enterica serovar Minnesota]
MSINLLDMYKGTEELELEGGAAEHVEAVAEEAAAREVAEATVEIQEQGEEIAQLVETVENLEEQVEELEETVEGMESLLRSGNFNAGAFAHMYNRAAKISANLGGRSVARMGAESFSDAATAQVMARDGMEGFMDKVKGWGKTAIEFIKNIFNAVISFFVGIFNKVEGLQRRHDALVKRVDAAEKVKEKVKLGGWNVWIDYEKNGASESKAAKLGDALKAVNSYCDVAKKVEAANLGAFNTAYKALIAALKAGTSGGKEASEGSKKKVMQEVGGIRILFTYEAEGAEKAEDAPKAAKALKLFVAKAPEAKKLTSGEVAAKTDKTGLKKALAEVAGSIAGLRTGKADRAFSAAERDRVIASLNTVKAANDEEAKERKGQVAIVRAVYSSGASILKTLAAAETSAADALLSCVAAHV